MNAILSPRPLSALFSEIRRVSGKDIKPGHEHDRDPHALGDGWVHIWVRGANHLLPAGGWVGDRPCYETNYGKLRPEVIDACRDFIFVPPEGTELFAGQNCPARLLMVGAHGIGIHYVCDVLPEESE